MPHKALMSWSGGKDSALALHHALRDPDDERVRNYPRLLRARVAYKLFAFVSF